MTLFKMENGDYVHSNGDIVNKKELLAILHISQSTLQRMMRQGLPFTMFSNYVAYDVKAVSTWLVKHGYVDVKLIAKWRKQSKKKEE